MFKSLFTFGRSNSNAQNKVIEEQAKILIENDVRLRKTLAELEKAYDELKRDKELLVSERNKLQVLVSGITDAVLALDSDCRIISLNPAAENMFHGTTQELVGRKVSEIVTFYKDNEPLSEEAFSPHNTSIAAGIVAQIPDLKMQFKEKEVKYANLVTVKLNEKKTDNLGVILTLHDLTNERELEEMKLDFVSMAAHELRTPLTSLRGNIYLYLKYFHDLLNNDQIIYIRRMNIATLRLNALVENLLNVTRIERKALTLHLEKVDWIQNVTTIIEELKDQINDKQIDLKLITPDQTLPFVYIDKFRISEVVTNLVSNAVTYTPKNGHVKIWFENQNEEVVTHIQDTGPGIPQDAIPHLFTKFFRVSGKLEQGSKGTGLGLYITKSIIDMHHDKIWVNSTEGQGSTFSFTLPTKHFTSDNASPMHDLPNVATPSPQNPGPLIPPS